MPLIVAHRGASRDAPENTLAAFRLAWDQGADAIEGDFRLTADGQVVCIHDADTRRVASADHVVHDTPLDALRQLDVGVGHGERFAGERMPTLAEVLATVPDRKRVFVEVKCGVEIIPPLIAGCDASGLAAEQVVVISFDERVIAEFKSRSPRHKALWLARIKGDGDAAVQTLDRIHADGISTCWDGVDRAFVAGVRSRGYEHHVWTVDDPAVAVRFAEWGSRSITTNAPADTRRALEAAGHG